MIRFALTCENDHDFESWFQSGEAFEKLKKAKQVSCPFCDSVKVSKSLMAPGVQTARKKRASVPDLPAEAPQAMVEAPDPKLAEAIKTLKDHVEKNSDYVGNDFAKEARAMHEGDKPSRAIHGEANVDDAKKLIEDGVPALPLPFIPRQKTN